MWSDPEDIPGWAVSPRGAGYLFGYVATNEVINNNITIINIVIFLILYIKMLYIFSIFYYHFLLNLFIIVCT
jgi:hypothetical protein